MSVTAGTKLGPYEVVSPLGATKGNILHLILIQGLMRAVVGIVMGMAGSIALTRILSSLLFGIMPTDTFVFGLVAVLLVGVTLLACYFPARRATRVDPMEALRYE